MLKELYDAVIKQPFDEERYSPQPKSKLKGFDVRIISKREKISKIPRLILSVDMGRAIPNEGSIIVAEEIGDIYQNKKTVLVENIHWIFNIEIKLPLIYNYDSLLNLERLENIDEFLYIDVDALKLELEHKFSILRKTVSYYNEDFKYKRNLFGW
ncbi:hypothetical protein BPT24_214 [Tenacibaculum phage pT24]|uniref:Uncharacterized protein n=1 Tax=Tenacibaculum phage pT24 TaxID=1880590 RepID=A0A1B4XX16_9CAUD|nr:hypothetical protein HYP10_gp214 [Tenacibaculum phage pT24]BAV39338.1 hypothetical protein BPT24_214 [Tenacibaculum phage pT24]